MNTNSGKIVGTVIALIGAYLILSLGCLTALLWARINIPDAILIAAFVSPMSGAVGALSAMLANTHTKSDEVNLPSLVMKD